MDTSFGLHYSGSFKKDKKDETVSRTVQDFTIRDTKCVRVSTTQPNGVASSISVSGTVHLILKSYLLVNTVTIYALLSNNGNGAAAQQPAPVKHVLWATQGVGGRARMMDPTLWDFQFALDLPIPAASHAPDSVLLRAVIERPPLSAGDVTVEMVVPVC